ncbi:MAG: hypothetical protein KBF78_14130 [Fuscovulum sp.]|nr:hypothetical protein [Fuscovulum sp.]
MTAAFCPQPAKQTLPPETVVQNFLAFRGASAEDVVVSRNVARPLARLRHELMWLLRDLTYLSLADIGQVMGGRDTTTVQHGIDQVADRMASDDAFRREMRFQRMVVTGAAPQLVEPTAADRLSPDLRLTAARGVLADLSLSDADARRAALQLLGAAHG